MVMGGRAFVFHFPPFLSLVFSRLWSPLSSNLRIENRDHCDLFIPIYTRVPKPFLSPCVRLCRLLLLLLFGSPCRRLMPSFLTPLLLASY
jgi:hypothetical protein